VPLLSAISSSKKKKQSDCWCSSVDHARVRHSKQAGGFTKSDGEPISDESIRLANTNLSRVGLREMVDLRSGDATEIVAGLPGPFDYVFFDADRFSAPAQLSLLIPKLTPDVLLLADNVLSHPNEIAAYLSALEALPQFERVIVPIGKGLSVAYRSAADY